MCQQCGKFGHNFWEKGKCPAAEEDGSGKKGKMNTMTSEKGEVGPGGTQSDTDECYDISIYISGEQEKQVNCEKLFQQRGNVVDTVKSNTFNKRCAFVAEEGRIGLYSMFLVDFFTEKWLLQNIRTLDERMRIVCNAGTIIVNKTGEFPR